MISIIYFFRAAYVIISTATDSNLLTATQIMIKMGSKVTRETIATFYGLQILRLYNGMKKTTYRKMSVYNHDYSYNYLLKTGGETFRTLAVWDNFYQFVLRIYKHLLRKLFFSRTLEVYKQTQVQLNKFKKLKYV